MCTNIEIPKNCTNPRMMEFSWEPMSLLNIMFMDWISDSTFKSIPKFSHFHYAKYLVLWNFIHLLNNYGRGCGNSLYHKGFILGRSLIVTSSTSSHIYTYRMAQVDQGWIVSMQLNIQVNSKHVPILNASLTINLLVLQLWSILW